MEGNYKLEKMKKLFIILLVAISLSLIFCLVGCSEWDPETAEWHYNENYHWKENKELTTVTTTNTDRHTFGDWILNNTPNQDGSFTEQRFCKCGYSETRTNGNNLFQMAEDVLAADLVIAGGEMSNFRKKVAYIEIDNEKFYYYITENTAETDLVNVENASTKFTNREKITLSTLPEVKEGSHYYTLSTYIGEKLWQGIINYYGNYQVIINGYTCIKDSTTSTWSIKQKS